jgi:N-acetylglucosaminyldiphosphoundecaprenol N-acetyl-beta-D-mannosaminyltransferase
MTPTVKNESRPTHDTIAAMDTQFSAAGFLQRRLRRSALSGGWRIAVAVSAWGKRLFDIILAAAVLTVLLPLFIAVALVLTLSRRPVFTSDLKVGRWSVPFRHLEFNTDNVCGALLLRLRLHRLPVFINVLRGEMSFIGPRAMRFEEVNVRQRAARKRSGVRPGLLSLWWLRKKANIHFGSELDVDLEYIDRQTVSGDLGIALRALPSILYGPSSAGQPAQVDVLGIPVDNLNMEEALQYILHAAHGDVPQQLCFVNTDCVNKSINDREYRDILRRSDLILADGIGIRLAGKITSREIRQNVNGTDLFPLLCQRLKGSDLGLFLLGARPEVVEDFSNWIKKTHPGVPIRGCRDGYFDPSQEEALLGEIRDSGARILLVAFGSPLQDRWIAKHLSGLGSVRVAMGVGGLFDFYSGRIPRAPQWMRELSLEWAYRLYQEPARMWRRYLVGNVVFLTRVILSVVFRRTSKTSSV